MEKKSQLTNEDVTKKFKSSFELVNYAIKLAENMIRTGRNSRVKSDVQNRAMLILEEIQQGKDHFDDLDDGSDDLDHANLDDVIHNKAVYEEALERRKFHTANILDGEE